MIRVKPGTVLEKEYKGEKVKVKALKDDKFAFNGKVYDDRGKLMKAITKGKTAQFTTFFGLGKSEENGEEKPRKVRAKETSADVSTVEEGSIEGIIRQIVRQELKNFLQNVDF